MEKIKIYKCGICGMAHSDIADRIDCETTCLAKQREAEEATRLLELEEEREFRQALIEEKYEELVRLVYDYVKDYGSLELSNFKNSAFPSNWLGKWWM